MTDGKSDFLRLFELFTDHLRNFEQMVALQLLRHWSRTGAIFPSVSTLAERTGLNRTTVMKAIQGLESKGVVRVSRDHGRSNRSELTGTIRLVAVSDQSASATSRPERLNQSASATQPVVHSDTKKPIKKSKKKSSWRVAPDDWDPSTEHQRIAREVGVDFEQELQKFKDHEFAKPKTNPDAAFRNWLRNAASFGGRSGARASCPQRGLAEGIGEAAW